ncbi:MAG TPA: DUF1499 domain-containing protein [Archangium sp.]|uniref:DUF1499 domain-containing protein n=1 Tax=Archangium sp. TaxID=1872627 RepID=UPI002E376AB1|nr:DUF1499 domain-containing protein [Archangium sp.]HEX5748279.1 DUF1499 domain-containing protein [Archangium sp.]
MFRSWSVRISLLAVLLLVLGPLLALVGLVPGMKALLLFASAAPVGLVGIVAGIVSAVRGRVAPGMTAVALGTLALVSVLTPAFAGGGKPPINDISTDLQDVPVFTHAGTLPENAGRNLEYPEDFKGVVRAYYPDLKSLKQAEPPDVVFARAVELARAQPGWTVTHVDAQGRTLEGFAETRLFRFRDDFVVRVRPEEGGGSRVDMRSKSRVGRGDLGANAARIHAFLQALAASGR